jgi:hypothetical protein
MNTVQYPDDVPASGQRRLSPRESAQRAKAMACVRGEDAMVCTPGSNNVSTCQGQVWVSIFFDGTGNNRGWQEPDQSQTQLQRNGHSNVARLFDAHHQDSKKGLFRVYVPGVGTPFPEIGENGGWATLWGWLTSYGGGGMGRYGADRINWAILQVLNSVHQYLTEADLIPSGTLATIVDNVSSSVENLGFQGPARRMVFNYWQEKLAAVVKSNQRKVTQINLALFGFSRGSATARACANWIAQIAEADGGGYSLAGVPVRTYFMGVFDTVASVGLADAVPGVDGHMAWADGNMGINAAVEECAHFIALHEQRATFPLENAGMGRQVAYPGMHSDVGGGYTPGDQGKGMPPAGAATAQLSQVPLVDMHHAATRAGVPVLSMDEINANSSLRGKFTVPADLRDTFNGFLRSHGVSRGLPLDTATRRHAEQYLQWRGLRAANLQAQPFFQRSPAKHQADMAQANAQMVTQAGGLSERSAANATPEGASREQTRDVVRGVIPLASLVVPDGREPLGRVEQQLLSAMRSSSSLPAPIVKLFDDYVHDSRAGFRIVGAHEPAWLTGGYFRYRRVFPGA